MADHTPRRHVLGSAIRYARTSRKLTQTDFAKLVGYATQPQVSEIESCVGALNEATLERVAGGLGISVRELLRSWLEGTCDNCGELLTPTACCPAKSFCERCEGPEGVDLR